MKFTFGEPIVRLFLRLRTVLYICVYTRVGISVFGYLCIDLSVCMHEYDIRIYTHHIAPKHACMYRSVEDISTGC